MAGSKTKTNVTTAMAIAGRASRACDVCGSQRARWFCAADDAYLCHRCDQNVHSANALSLRHERVRLNPNGSSLKLHKSSAKPSSHLKTSDNSEGVVTGRSSSTATTPTHKNQKVQSPSLPSRKRSRLSTRPNPHLKCPVSFSKAPIGSSSARKKTKREDHGKKSKVKVEDMEFENPRDGTHEVPDFITVNIQESHLGFHEGHEGASSQSLAEYFKGKSAVDVDVDAQEELSGDSDQFLVPTGYLDSGVDFDGAMGSLIGEDGTFIGGDVFGEMELCGSRDLSEEDYNLDISDIVGLRGDALERDCCEISEAGGTSEAGTSKGDGTDGLESCEYEARGGPFTKSFTYKVKAESFADCTETIKKEAAEMLRCSLEGLSEEEIKHVPSLRLNYEDVLSAWSDKSLWTDGKRPQTVPDDSNSEAAVCVFLVLISQCRPQFQ